MSSIRENVAALVDHAEKFSLSSGRTSGGFKKMHMEEIRKIEKIARNSKGSTDEFIQSLRKHLTHRNPVVRERVAYLLGELFHVNPKSKEVALSVDKLIECSNNKKFFEPSATSGREMINALGKSGSIVAESHLLSKLNDPSTAPIRQNILVALGKTGGEQTVNILLQLVKQEKISLQEKIFTLWALGKLGSVQNTTKPNFPLPRSLFESALQDINKLIKGNVKHPNVHYCAIYAIGEICDQRDASKLKEPLKPEQLQEIEKTIFEIVNNRKKEFGNSIKSLVKFKARAEIHVQNLINISEKVTLKMIRGQKLDADGERILFAVRILFDAIAPPETEAQLPDLLTITPQPDHDEIAQHESLINLAPLQHTNFNAKPPEIDADLKILTENNALNKTKAPESISNPDNPAVDMPASQQNVDFTLFLDSPSDIEEEIEHQMSLRKALKSRQRGLEVDEATKGINTPAEVKNELREISKKIIGIEEKVIKLRQKLDQLNRKETKK